MNNSILIFGQGGREHALAYCLSKKHEQKIVVSPGNAGISRDFECISLEGAELSSYIDVAKKVDPNLIIIGPEDPLALGVVDALTEAGFAVFGPTKACARLESSKSFMKEICQKAQIKTAGFQMVKSHSEVDAFFAGKSGRFVIKSDGLCAGKGVTVCDDVEHAQKTAKLFLGVNSKPLFGSSSQTVLVEEFLLGMEMSVIGICDGDDAVLLAPVRDHKRLHNNDSGPNTGGMGVVGPVLDGDAQTSFLNRVKNEIFLPTLKAMKEKGTPYRGFLYAGLMVNEESINLLEFNVRLGDPEAQALLFGTDIDLYKICSLVAKGGHLRDLKLENIKLKPTAVVVLASPGYPQSPEVNKPIEGLEEFAPESNTHLFFAGVKKNAEGNIITASGRVLACAATGENLTEALENCYQTLKTVSFSGAQYRTDIGHSLL